jgi:hypothetical protein
MLSQLTYMSSRTVTCTDSEIENILQACKKNNPGLGITGVLLYSDDKFIQMVEGNASIISGLYDKIKGDSRHKEVRMISYSHIKEKSFPSWHMGAKQLKGLNAADYLTDITAEEKATFSKILNGEEENSARVVGLLKRLF